MFRLLAPLYNLYLAKHSLSVSVLGSALLSPLPCHLQGSAADTYLILVVLMLPNNETSSALQSAFKKLKLSSTVSTIKLSTDECLWWSVLSFWRMKGKILLFADIKSFYTISWLIFQIALNNKPISFFFNFILNILGELVVGTPLIPKYSCWLISQPASTFSFVFFFVFPHLLSLVQELIFLYLLPLV